MNLKLTRIVTVSPRLLKKIQQFYKWGFDIIKTDDQIEVYSVVPTSTKDKNNELIQNCAQQVKKYFDPELKLIRLSFSKLKSIVSEVCKQKSVHIAQWQKQSICECVFKELKLVYVTIRETVPFVFTV